MTKSIAFLFCATTAFGALGSTASAGEDAWQMNQLFNPSPLQIAMEGDKARVMIYDGLSEATVERALEEQFDRIEHMMFVRTRSVAANGEVEIDDDGCD